MYGLKKRSKQDESGLIQGAGTGTSDDIQKNVPAGSYIMPADSTAKLGARNLKNLGKPQTTEVNVSNGEYLASPEQLQAIGGFVLDRMKNATHTPVDQPQLGFKPNQNKPRLSFADGGLVDDDPTKWTGTDTAKAAVLGGGAALSGATKVANSVPTIQTAANAAAPKPVTVGQTAKALAGGAWDGAKAVKNTNIPGISGNVAKTGLGRAGLVGALATTAFDTATTPTEQYRERFGLGDYNANDSNGMRFAKDLGVRTLGAASDLGNAFTLGLAGKLYQDKQNIAQNVVGQSSTPQAIAAPQTKTPAVDTTTKAPLPTTDLNKQNTSTNTNNTVQPKVDMFSLGQNSTGTQPQSNPYAIQQKDNSFSYANPDAAAQARKNGIQESGGLGFRVKPANDPKGVANLMANTQQMGPTQQQIDHAIAQRENAGFGMRINNYNQAINHSQGTDIRTPEQEAQLQADIARVSERIPGSRGLTASQRNQINDLQMGYLNRASDVYKTDANNAAAWQREALGQAGQNYRTELGEQGTNKRFKANLDFETQKFGATNDLDNRKFSEEQLNNMPARMKQAYEINLLKAYDAAQTPEEKQSLSERLGMVRGQQSQKSNPYIQIKQGEIVDEKGNITQPSKEYLYNYQTNKTIDPLANMQSQPQIPHAAIDALKADPKKAMEFDLKYGQGSSAQYLKG